MIILVLFFQLVTTGQALEPAREPKTAWIRYSQCMFLRASQVDNGVPPVAQVASVIRDACPKERQILDNLVNLVEKPEGEFQMEMRELLGDRQAFAVGVVRSVRDDARRRKALAALPPSKPPTPAF